MNTNLEKFDALVSPEQSGWHDKAKERAENQAWRDKAFDIALQLIRHTRNHKITQVKLAEMMGVSPQYINRVFQGKENLTLDTICKFEAILGISLLSAGTHKQEITPTIATECLI